MALINLEKQSNICDYATLEQLVVLFNMEEYQRFVNVAKCTAKRTADTAKQYSHHANEIPRKYVTNEAIEVNRLFKS